MSRRWFAGLVAILVLLGASNGWLFLTGYRLTADDVSFHRASMAGLSHAFEVTRTWAVGQGRIGHFIDLPLSMVAARFADDPGFRAFYTTLYFAMLALFGAYVSQLAGRRCGLLTGLILITQLGLEYHHLPPNAYPFHISVPMIAVLVARIALSRARRGGGTAAESGWLALLCFGMLCNEKTFVFAVALLVLEALWAITRDAGQKGLVPAVTSRLRDRGMRRDLVPVMLVVTVYVAFRIAFPSGYDGNQLPSTLAPFAFLKTLFAHIFAGSSIGAVTRSLKDYGAIFAGLRPVQWGLFATMFVAAGAASFALLRASHPDDCVRRRYFVFAVLALLGAVIVTAPIAVTEKYQSWCGDIRYCLFVDSRISFVFLGGACAALMLGLQDLGRDASSRLRVAAGLSAVLAVMSVLNYAHNVHVEADMRDYVSGWDRAKRLACASEDELRALGADLPSLVEPRRRISFHANFDVGAYWWTYIATLREKSTCGGTVVRVADLLPRLPVGETIQVDHDRPGGSYFVRGWTRPDGPGIRAIDREATMLLPAGGARGSVVVEAKVRVDAAHPRRRVSVSVNDAAPRDRVFENPGPHRFDLRIPDPSSNRYGASGLVKIVFTLLDSDASPGPGPRGAAPAWWLEVRTIGLE